MCSQDSCDWVKEHLSLWRADDSGLDKEWTLVSTVPMLGWGNSSAEPQNFLLNEDPFLWIDERGWHILTHSQNRDSSSRGAYGWSLDGLAWHVANNPQESDVSVWETDVRWENGTVTSLGRRQRPSLIRDPNSGQITHLVNGADFLNSTQHGDPPGFCEGCHWGTGLTLIQPVKQKHTPLP